MIEREIAELGRQGAACMQRGRSAPSPASKKFFLPRKNIFFCLTIMKREDDDDTIPSEVVFFAHAPTATAPAAMPEFDENHLVPLTPGQESERRFPPGCPVWYCIDYSSSLESEAR
jgi:hypothetical protein